MLERADFTEIEGKTVRNRLGVLEGDDQTIAIVFEDNTYVAIGMYTSWGDPYLTEAEIDMDTFPREDQIRAGLFTKEDFDHRDAERSSNEIRRANEVRRRELLELERLKDKYESA